MTSPQIQSETAHEASPRVVAVVVTYNRQELLPVTLKGIASGDQLPAAVVVINNASTDGTAEYLENLEYSLPVDIVNLSKNLGGAGGFTVGIDRALVRHKADLVWVMDDDTEPTESTLSEAVKAWSNYRGAHGEHPAFVASKVEWTDGRDHPMNTMRTKFGASAAEFSRARVVGARPIRSASFVSVMMDAAVMRREGLPIADFFIWNDDFEYTTRLAHGRDAIATSQSVVIHHTKSAGNTDFNPGPRFYNDVRNKLWLFCRRRTLTPLEKFLYGGSTLRLWITTVLRTDDKKTYLTYLARGIKDALVPFRSNDEVLQGIYELEFPRFAQQWREQNIQQEGNPPFSVLMGTYAQDNPLYLDQAIASNLRDQTVRPHQFVVVADGPLTPELNAILEKWESLAVSEKLTDFTIVRQAENSGLASALNLGLQVCKFELVARADSDDISLPERFEEQLEAMAGTNLAVLGSALYEVDASGQKELAVRKATCTSLEIARVLPQRNPIFHPTVMFRKSAVLSVGSYEEVPGAEDYWLWARLNQAGYGLKNLPQPLVKYRTEVGAYTKRGGVQALKQDIQVQKRLYRGHVVSAPRVAQNLLVRSAYRFIPLSLRQKLFRRFFTESSVASTPEQPQSKEK